MNRKELIKKYIDFFKSKGHKQIPNSSLIPENDPTVLFTTAGMHPLVPYLLGQPHPSGKRLCNVQRCIRTGDIDEVGDEVHHTFFEMLGNWSLGDYFKKEAIEFSFEFLTKILKINVEKLAVTCFAGDENAPKDEESSKKWESLGISKERIAFLPKKNNWWGPAGKTGPCGPDTEMFYWKDNSQKPPKVFDPRNNRWVEIWNDVLMQYKRQLKKITILVDGMFCLYDKEFKINQELLDIINNFGTWNILVVNGFKEKGYSLVDSSNWAPFSLEEEGIKKDKPEYFKRLLNQYQLTPEEVIYFDHDKNNVKVAKSIGIISKQFTNIKSIKEFIEENIYEYVEAKQKNIDTGMGVERTTAVLNGIEDNYQTGCFLPIIKEIEKISKKKYSENKREMRIIADHLKASVFIINDGIIPSNTEQGYVLRRLIRRAIRYGKKLGLKDFTKKVSEKVFEVYGDYESLQKNKENILKEINREETKFNETIEKGLNIFNKIIKDKKCISGEEAFLLYQSYGFPIELIEEECSQRKINFCKKEFSEEMEKHQELSRTATAGKFKSGLADNSEQTTKLHTATHLLLAALRIVLKDENIMQKGSNITAERLRVDFNFPRKMTEEEVKETEDLVNEQIKKSCKVLREEMSPSEAKKQGAIGVFENKYGEKVSVYTIGKFSKEICTGPHVKNTCDIGKIKIVKEESSSAGVRRIKAIIKN